jgi:hypothetical protein
MSNIENLSGAASEVKGIYDDISTLITRLEGVKEFLEETIKESAERETPTGKLELAKDSIENHVPDFNASMEGLEQTIELINSCKEA